MLTFVFQMVRRQIPIVVVSDVHLGTYGCHARELVSYLRSIQPEVLVLNGDIIDVWQFSKNYFPASHMQVLKELFKLMSLGTKIYYITGNHDDVFRKYSDLQLGNLVLTDKLLMKVDGKTVWMFHGDVFDHTTKGYAKILAKLGGKGYDLLILLNRSVNYMLNTLGMERVSFSKKVKQGVKKAIAWIDNFETTAAEIAINQNYHTVICGHIHSPQKRVVANTNGSVLYLNSGDWVENCTALEYENENWNIFNYFNSDLATVSSDTIKKENHLVPDLVSANMFLQFKKAN